MASRDSEAPPTAPRRGPSGEDPEVLTKIPAKASRYTNFEESVFKCFQRIREAILEIEKSDPEFGILTSVGKSRYIMRYCTQRFMCQIGGGLFPETGTNLVKAFSTLFMTASIAASYRGVKGTPVPTAEINLDRVFASLANLKNEEAAEYVAGASRSEELEKLLLELFSRVKWVLAEFHYFVITDADDDKGIVKFSLAEYQSSRNEFENAFAVLYIIIGFLAAEIAVSRPSLPAVETVSFESPPVNSFCFDLYLFMGYRFYVISVDDYERLRRKPIRSHFNSLIGRAIILLNHAYRVPFQDHLKTVMSYFSRNMPQHNSYYYVTRFVRDSMRTNPSTYRYMVLLSLIAEVALTLFHNGPNSDPLTHYLNEACKYYHESGMCAFETLMRNDNFHDLQRRADRLCEAWPDLFYDAIGSQYVRTAVADQLFEQHGRNFDYLDAEAFLSRTSIASDESVTENLEELNEEDDITNDVPPAEEVLEELRNRLAMLPSDFRAEGGPSNEESQGGSADRSFVPPPEAREDPTTQEAEVVDVSSIVPAEVSPGVEPEAGAVGGAEGGSNPDGQEAGPSKTGNSKPKSKRKRSKKKKGKR